MNSVIKIKIRQELIIIRIALLKIITVLLTLQITTLIISEELQNHFLHFQIIEINILGLFQKLKIQYSVEDSTITNKVHLHPHSGNKRRLSINKSSVKTHQLHNCKILMIYNMRFHIKYMKKCPFSSDRKPIKVY